MTRRFLTVAACSFLCSVGGAAAHDMASMAAAPASAPQAEPAALAPNAVAIDNFAFAPQMLVVAAGATVSWTNHDDDIHTVVSADHPARFKSPPLDSGDHFTFTFKQPGTYRYFCSIHPSMTGTVVVK
jgi:plastocyanin